MARSSRSAIASRCKKAVQGRGPLRDELLLARRQGGWEIGFSGA